MNEERVSSGRWSLRKSSLTVPCGKTTGGQYGRHKEQRKEAGSVWLGTGGFAEEVATGRHEGPGGFIQAGKEQQAKDPGARLLEAGEPRTSWGVVPTARNDGVKSAIVGKS